MRGVIVLLVIIGAVAAVPSSPQRIVGGTETTVEAYPYIAALLYSSGGITFSQACGGSILNNRSILTAAHCTFGDAASKWRVRVGSTYANSGGTVIATQSIINHAGFNTASLNNDIAVLRAATTIVYSAVVQPAYIAGSNYNLADNQVVWAAGWGATYEGGPGSEVLQHVQLWIINYLECNQRYSYALTGSMLCAGAIDTGGLGQCQGDSGSPLLHNGVVVGVFSQGRCGEGRFPGVNSNVPRLSAWIQANA